MRSSSRALAALRRSARKDSGAFYSLQQEQRAVEALSTGSGDLEARNDFKPALRSPEHFEESAHKTPAHTDMQKRGFFRKRNAFRGTECDGALSFNSSLSCKRGQHYDLKRPLGGFTICKQPSNLMYSSTSMVSQRQFASRSKGGGDDDEDVFDDVESRLMGEDYARDDMYMGDSSHTTGGVSFEDYGEWAKGEDESEVEEGEGDSEGEEGEGDSEGEGSAEGSDEDSEEDSANEQSDEEFEDERSDEELDELLANTPLFNPPELPESFRPDEPLPQFSFRPEGPVYYPGMEYEPEELDVTRPLPIRKREMRPKEEISVEEVVDLADFRNVRYLTKFITETGCILARREFKMRKKSHNRITKAIKTARFFGLMPYTNMGRPKFIFNEPFDEFSEFYETDEDEKRLGDMPIETTYESGFGSNFGSASPRDGGFGRNFGSTAPRNSGYFGQGRGGFSGQNTRRRF